MNLVTKYYVRAKNYMNDLVSGEEGVGTVEMVLIIFVLIALAILFRDKASALITKYFGEMENNINNGLVN